VIDILSRILSLVSLSRSRVSCPVAPHSLSIPPALPSYSPSLLTSLARSYWIPLCLNPPLLLNILGIVSSTLFLIFRVIPFESGPIEGIPTQLARRRLALSRHLGRHSSLVSPSLTSLFPVPQPFKLATPYPFLLPFLCEIRSGFELTRTHRPYSAFLNF